MVTETNSSHVWYKQGAGRRFVQAEQKELNRILPTLYGYHLLFLGEPTLASFVNSSLISHRICVNPTLNKESEVISNLAGSLDELPLRSDSIDVVVLSHALEQSAHPHEVLRETHRILIPEGHLVITGFNPISMWGMWYASKKLVGGISHGKLLSPNRIKDWLKLLNFQIIGGSMFCFGLPLNHEQESEKGSFMEKWGERCWPFFGGAYSLVAVKRVIPLTPIKTKWRPEPLWQGAPGLKPTTSSTYQQNKD